MSGYLDFIPEHSFERTPDGKFLFRCPQCCYESFHFRHVQDAQLEGESHFRKSHETDARVRRFGWPDSEGIYR